MSSITRIMQGLPFAKGTQARTKIVGDLIYTTAKMPDGRVEKSIIKRNKDGMQLLKSVFIDGDRVEIYRPGKTDLRINRATGRRIDLLG